MNTVLRVLFTYVILYIFLLFHTCQGIWETFPLNYTFIINRGLLLDIYKLQTHNFISFFISIPTIKTSISFGLFISFYFQFEKTYPKINE